MNEAPPPGLKNFERMLSGKEPDSHAVYQVKVTLRGSRPPIWRRLRVASGMSLNELHQVLQIVMEWDHGYAYQFDDGLFWYGQDFTDAFGGFVPGGEDDTKTRLCDVAGEEGARFDYNYCLNQMTLEGLWRLRVQVEKILGAAEGLRVPLCLDGKRARPPEDFPGIKNYEECLGSFRDPNDPARQEARDTLGHDFDPDAFDADEINNRLAKFETLRSQPELWKRKPSEALGSGRPPVGGRWVYGTRSRKR